ncbi:hypothetical protein ACZ91_08170 [Streptomyces regensis]|nr:hypothetical protein ACZ91_08170 [Streptomyces regensis]KOG61771.1 hypothetical protein ADK77_29715 [Streptomyces antibioticus]
MAVVRGSRGGGGRRDRGTGAAPYAGVGVQLPGGGGVVPAGGRRGRKAYGGSAGGDPGGGTEEGTGGRGSGVGGCGRPGRSRGKNRVWRFPQLPTPPVGLWSSSR